MLQAVCDNRVLADLSVPRLITKELRLSTLALPSGEVRRRLRLSSNFLRLAGFTAETRVSATPIGKGKGLQISFDPAGDRKVHLRSYGRRRSNPLETQLDLQSQQLLDAAIPSYTEACRWEIAPGKIMVLPLANRVFTIGRSMRRRPLEERLEAFVGLTGGCDVSLMESEGFRVTGLLEFRPQEARDAMDRTETGALNALANGRHVRILANESVYSVDWTRIASALDSRDGVIGCLHVSPQCDDFSALKTHQARQDSVDNLSSTIDMVVPLLRGVDELMPATVVVENVPGFLSSQAGLILQLQLRRTGYHVAAEVLDATQYGGRTTRKRAYIVASIWPGFAFPAPSGVSAQPIHELLADRLHELRDVSSTTTFQKGVACGRARIVRQGDTTCPTITKSQPRMAKDSVVIEDQGRFRFIDGEASKRLMGLGQVNTSLVTTDLEAEIIGQSVEGPMHGALMRSVREHILHNTGAPGFAVNARLF